ncbi:hypothetical protein IQ277_03915 [Nostocales cyanobacterium LEGE 12452]|nr:hypothetical protein [Nostocales cyanobacterium LEGE 12452]
MQSFQVVEQLETLREVLKSTDINAFMECLSMLNDCRNQLNTSMVNVLDSKADTNVTSQQLGVYRKNITNLQAEIKTRIKPKLVFTSLERLRTAFSIFVEELNQEAAYINTIYSQFIELENVYDKFIQDYSYSSTVELVSSGTDLFHSLKNTEEISTIIWINLHNQYEHDDSLGSLSLLLDSDYTYKDFIKKLETLQKLYSELCFLLHISESDFPLRIMKIESGSLFVKIFGESKVIQLISDLIKETTSFLYRNKTTEGKIESIPRKTEAIESILKLREKLQQAGIKVDVLDESVEKSSILLAEELNCLLAGQPKVELNGEILHVGNYKTQKLLDTSNKYLLEGGKD